MEELQRYELDRFPEEGYYIAECPDGEYVKYTDACKALTEARKEWLEEEMEKLKDEKMVDRQIVITVYRDGSVKDRDPAIMKAYNEAIDDQISRLEAELKALDK